MAEPGPLRLAWRDFIRRAIREVFCHSELDPSVRIQAAVAREVPADERHNVQALVVEELTRFHEGVLARYG